MQKTISKFLADLKIPVSESYCESLILSHADFPSLLSIVDTLDTLGISNVAGKIEKDKLPDLNFPYVLQLNTGAGDVVAIKNAKDLAARQYELQAWDGIVLKIEPPSTISDEENNRLYKKEKFYKVISIVFVVAMAALLLWPVIGNHSFTTVLLTMTALAGASIGYFLVAKELGTRYSLVENFCTTGKKNNCDKILNSDDAKLFGDIKLSDTVLAYFVFQIIFLAALTAWPQASPAMLATLSILSFLCLPIVIFSVYYQHFIAKTWCRLCLLVDGVLIIQLIIFGYLNINNAVRLSDISFETMLLEAFVFTIIGSLILLSKNVIERYNKLTTEYTRSLRVKNNSAVFQHFLSRQRVATTAEFMEHEILLGENSDAPIKIITVSNLYCNPCKNQHEEIEQLLNIFPDKIQVAVRFVVAKDSGANRHIFQYWLKNIRNKPDEAINTRKLIHAWYEVMDLDKFKIKFPFEGATNPIGDEMVTQHLAWIKKQEAYRTPTFFINGYQMPDVYYMKDLKSLVVALAAESKPTPVKMTNAEPVIA
jgi:uncharacterized membrane protein